MADSAADDLDTGPKNSAELHAAFVGPAESAAMAGNSPAVAPENAPAPVATWKLLLPLGLVFIAIVAGLLIPKWGWVLLAAVSLYFAWTLVMGWRSMTSLQRLMRAATLFMSIALTLVTALPR